MAPYLSLSPRYYDCDPGYNWYTCNIAGQSYYGCCSVDPCGSITFCPAEHQDVKSVEPGSATIAATSMSSSTTAYPRSTYPTLNDNAPPNSGGSPPPDGDYGPATTISSTYTESTGQAGVAIAATVGALGLILLIVFCLSLYRFLVRRAREAREARKAREAREEERRIKKKRRYGVCAKRPLGGSSGLSSDRTSTSPGQGCSWENTPSPGISPSPSPRISPLSYDGAYDHPYPTDVDYRYETRYGVHYSTQLPTPPSPARRPARNTSRSHGLGAEAFRFENRIPVVPPVSPRSSSDYPDTSPFDETNPHNYRRRPTIPISPKRAATMPPEGLFAGIPERLAPDGSGYPETHAKASNNPFQTRHRPVGYHGGPVTPVWDSDGVLQEIYVEDWAGTKQ
ncbi:hypothetical protein CONLIGDRAFT_665656 [Coniochaeta ligniaria NRRL 30616]|uniref:Uncharacterized protein n=1 Tax=Coniochaeta ligniaria NRRL 30616 TaxID=1408157 RepID=A0A1J7J6I9_9PEZI|nr:hypothetical protein CONLIGDRAFT_665656 [Coniochaeta ligniaria NRRL 30616]